MSREGLVGEGGELVKVGEVGPMNWYEGTACKLYGWKRFTNSRWEQSHLNYRFKVERSL